MTSRRGLTLLEMLLALGLLAGLTAALATWLQITARTSADIRTPLSWHGAAERALQLLADDILVGDVAPAAPRLAIVERGIAVRTRETLVDGKPGPITHRYVHLPQSRTLVLRAQGTGQATERVLLEGVEGFSCERDEESDHVTVTIVGHGLTLARRFPWT